MDIEITIIVGDRVVTSTGSVKWGKDVRMTHLTTSTMRGHNKYIIDEALLQVENNLKILAEQYEKITRETNASRETKKSCA